MHRDTIWVDQIGETPPSFIQARSPVFWACGVTPQAVALEARPELMITHEPGIMFLTDLPRETGTPGFAGAVGSRMPSTARLGAISSIEAMAAAVVAGWRLVKLPTQARYAASSTDRAARAIVTHGSTALPGVSAMPIIRRGL